MAPDRRRGQRHSRIWVCWRSAAISAMGAPPGTNRACPASPPPFASRARATPSEQAEEIAARVERPATAGWIGREQPRLQRRPGVLDLLRRDDLIGPIAAHGQVAVLGEARGEARAAVESGELCAVADGQLPQIAQELAVAAGGACRRLQVLRDEIASHVPDMDVDRNRQVRKVALHHRLDRGPVELAVAAAEVRKGDRGDAQVVIGRGEARETCLDVLELRGELPRRLGREVQHPAIGAPPQHEGSHPQAPDIAQPPVLLEHPGIALLERLGDPLAHDPDRIDGVDQGLRRRGEEVAFEVDE
jgi:hypothetical protein